MKNRALLTLILLLALFPLQAVEYPYLTFVMTDGSTVSLTVSDLSLSVGNGRLSVTNTDGTCSFELTKLSKMCFTVNNVASLDKMEIIEGEVEVSDLRGVWLGNYENLRQAVSCLPSGIYVVKNKTRTFKISVK